MIEQKDWGTAEHLKHENKHRVVQVEIAKGWQCSTHIHAQQANGFFVISGLLAVVEEPGTRHERKRILGQGMSYVVPVGVPHCFQSLTKVVALEIYLATENGVCSALDINRSVPGKRTRTDE